MDAATLEELGIAELNLCQYGLNDYKVLNLPLANCPIDPSATLTVYLKGSPKDLKDKQKLLTEQDMTSLMNELDREMKLSALFKEEKQTEL